jgi:hypothetical protein
MLAQAEDMAFNPAVPLYIRVKALGSYNAMRARMDKADETRAAKRKEREAEHAEATRVYVPHLPDNGRTRSPEEIAANKLKPWSPPVGCDEWGVPLSLST